MADDAEESVREKLAKNPKTPPLVRDSDSDVKAALEGNPVLTPELLRDL